MRLLSFCVIFPFQPIYLRFLLPHGKGKDEDDVESRDFVKPPLKKVISINGQEVETSNFDDINIHDFAEFEQEQHITRKFFSTIRRKRETNEFGHEPIKKQLSFQEVAKEVCRAENVLLAFRHYSHRSDSETEDESDAADLDTDSIGCKNCKQQEPSAFHIGKSPDESNKKSCDLHANGSDMKSEPITNGSRHAGDGNHVDSNCNTNNSKGNDTTTGTQPITDKDTMMMTPSVKAENYGSIESSTANGPTASSSSPAAARRGMMHCCPSCHIL